MELSGVMLVTDRIDACADFYATLLDAPGDRGAGWVHFPLSGGRMLALHTPWSPHLAVEGGSTVLLLDVASLAAETARLAGHGIAVGEPHAIPGGQVGTLADPDGRLVQLVERSG